MKMLIISFVFWILIIPSLVASFLILTLLQPSYLPVYFAVAWFGIAFGAALLLCGPFRALSTQRVRTAVVV